jgi:predicted nucleotide-binding protein (sugar kinase/HSP70/actin superfamily)
MRIYRDGFNGDDPIDYFGEHYDFTEYQLNIDHEIDAFRSVPHYKETKAARETYEDFQEFDEKLKKLRENLLKFEEKNKIA